MTGDIKDIAGLYVVEMEAYSRLFSDWARSRDPWDASRDDFDRDLIEALRALSAGVAPRRGTGLDADVLAGLAASGVVVEADAATRGHIASMAQESTKEASGGRARWAEFLATLAEHPGLPADELEVITEYRLRNDLASTRCLVSEADLARSGHQAPAGTPCCMLAPRKAGPRREGSERIPHYAAQLIPGRIPPAPRFEARLDDPASMDALFRAASTVDLDMLDPISEYAFSLRYGLSVPGDAIPPVPKGPSSDVIRSQLDQASRRTAAVCRKIERSLKLGNSKLVRRDPAAPESRRAAIGAPDGQGDDEGRRRAMDPASVTTADLKRMLAERSARAEKRGGGHRK